MSENSYWMWDHEISDEACDQIIDRCQGQWNSATTLGQTSGKKDYDPAEVRQSEVIWINEQWIYDLTWRYMLAANEQAGWKYDIVAAEDCQITRYLKDGFYSWHIDGMGSHNGIYDEPKTLIHGNTRKLSMSIILNDGYEGGDLELANFYLGSDFNKKKRIPKLGKGDILIFPSFLTHRVTPVTKGIRYSLVLWFVGPPFQ